MILSAWILILDSGISCYLLERLLDLFDIPYLLEVVELGCGDDPYPNDGLLGL